MSAGVIVAVILILLLIAAGVVFLVLWLRERDKNKNNKTPNVIINNPKFTLSANGTTVTASWDSVGQADDQVTLYASKKQIQIGTNGKPIDGSGVLSSNTNTTPNTTKSVSISGLEANQTYNLQLVNFNTNVFTNINYVIYTNTVLQGEFHIVDTSGGNVITLGTDNTTITMETIAKGHSRDIWEYDQGQFGGAATFTLFNKANNVEPEIVLFNDSGKLVAKELSTLSQTQINNQAQWVYSVDKKANQWCLRNDTTTCFEVSSTTPTQVEVVKDSKSPTSWANKTPNDS